MPEPAYIPLYTAAQVQEFDRNAIQQQGIAGYELMCRAGKALADCVPRHWPQARRVSVLCGPGNNGGDGYVLARLLRESGLAVEVHWLSDPDKLGGDARLAADACRGGGAALQAFSGRLPEASDLLVDALLGTGLDRPVEGAYLAAIQALNSHRAPVLAADIPSGLHADTGRVLGDAVRARVTVTFIGRKRGLYTGCGADHAGDIVFEDLAVPSAVYADQMAAAELIAQPPWGPLAQARQRSAHKGHFGHVLVIGGERGMAGATRLAAEAAARCGAGLVSVATRPEHAPNLIAGRPELMVHGVATAADLAPLLARASILVVGPGLGRTAWSRQLFESALAAGLPLVVDADALNLLAADPLPCDNWILTPHPAEAGRLLGSDRQTVQADRFAAVQQLAQRYRGVAVLKGAGSLIAAPTGPVRVCARGNPGMASGGMGDILSGVLGALLAQGLDAAAAATAGVFLHAGAADLAAREQGERGLLASDLIPFMRRVINGLA